MTEQIELRVIGRRDFVLGASAAAAFAAALSMAPGSALAGALEDAMKTAIGEA